jgi:hypothetical protein
MNEAADRVSRVTWKDPRAAFAAVGETLWWIVVVDTSLAESAEGRAYVVQRTRDPAGRLLIGLRHARNRFAHDFNVLEYVDPHAVLESDPRGFVTIWRWRSLSPTRAKGKRGHEEYERRLAGRDVNASLVEALTFLRAAAWGRGVTPLPRAGSENG